MILHGKLTEVRIRKYLAYMFPGVNSAQGIDNDQGHLSAIRHIVTPLV